jgi:hypothetical protein
MAARTKGGTKTAADSFRRICLQESEDELIN